MKVAPVIAPMMAPTSQGLIMKRINQKLMGKVSPEDE